MKILAFDVSTTATGCALYDQTTKEHQAKLFQANGKVPYERIRSIARDVSEWIKDKEFDMVLITKASYSQMSPNILQLEGILLAIAVQRDIPFDYYPDNSWYSLIGNNRDERPTKKKKSVERYVNQNGLKVFKQDVKMVGSKLDKINVLVKHKGIDEKQFWISDDIADAWNAANLFEVRQQRDKVRFEKSKTQEQINKLSKENTKLRNNIKLLNIKLARTKSEKTQYKKSWESTNHKGKYNSYIHRKEQIKEIGLSIEEIENTININTAKIDALRIKKNTLN